MWITCNQTTKETTTVVYRLDLCWSGLIWRWVTLCTYCISLNVRKSNCIRRDLKSCRWSKSLFQRWLLFVPAFPKAGPCWSRLPAHGALRSNQMTFSSGGTYPFGVITARCGTCRAACGAWETFSKKKKKDYPMSKRKRSKGSQIKER